MKSINVKKCDSEQEIIFKKIRDVSIGSLNFSLKNKSPLNFVSKEKIGKQFRNVSLGEIFNDFNRPVKIISKVFKNEVKSDNKIQQNFLKVNPKKDVSFNLKSAKKSLDNLLSYKQNPQKVNLTTLKYNNIPKKNSQSSFNHFNPKDIYRFTALTNNVTCTNFNEDTMAKGNSFSNIPEFQVMNSESSEPDKGNQLNKESSDDSSFMESHVQKKLFKNLSEVEKSRSKKKVNNTKNHSEIMIDKKIRYLPLISKETKCDYGYFKKVVDLKKNLRLIRGFTKKKEEKTENFLKNYEVMYDRIKSFDLKRKVRLEEMMSNNFSPKISPEIK